MMTKRELIDEIRRLNWTAEAEFLAAFDEIDLVEYLDKLNRAQGPRPAKDWEAHKDYVSCDDTVIIDCDELLGPDDTLTPITAAKVLADSENCPLLDPELRQVLGIPDLPEAEVVEDGDETAEAIPTAAAPIHQKTPEGLPQPSLF